MTYVHLEIKNKKINSENSERPILDHLFKYKDDKSSRNSKVVHDILPPSVNRSLIFLF